MTDGEALHQGILLNPTDNDVRLIYADWLDENNQPEKAEFIRVQCQLATFDSSYFLSYHNREMCENSAVPLVKRSAELLHPAWSKDLYHWSKTWDKVGSPLVGSMNAWEFRRGFFHRIEITVMEFMRLAKVIFRHHPVQHVKLTDLVVGGYLQRPGTFIRIGTSLRIHHDGTGTALPMSFKMLLKGRVDYTYPSEVDFQDYQYDTEELAHEDISQACVAFGRQLVGLDALTFELAGT